VRLSIRKTFNAFSIIKCHSFSFFYQSEWEKKFNAFVIKKFYRHILWTKKNKCRKILMCDIIRDSNEWQHMKNRKSLNNDVNWWEFIIQQKSIGYSSVPNTTQKEWSENRLILFTSTHNPLNWSGVVDGIIFVGCFSHLSLEWHFVNKLLQLTKKLKRYPWHQSLKFTFLAQIFEVLSLDIWLLRMLIIFV
jgi:hypothetical protein